MRRHLFGFLFIWVIQAQAWAAGPITAQGIEDVKTAVKIGSLMSPRYDGFSSDMAIIRGNCAALENSKASARGPELKIKKLNGAQLTPVIEKYKPEAELPRFVAYKRKRILHLLSSLPGDALANVYGSGLIYNEPAKLMQNFTTILDDLLLSVKALNGQKPHYKECRQMIDYVMGRAI